MSAQHRPVPFATQVAPIPPHMTRVAHYAHFDNEVDARVWSALYPHDGQLVSRAPRGDWTVKWITQD